MGKERCGITREELVRLLHIEHKTLAEVGEIYGCTRGNIWKHVKKWGIGVGMGSQGVPRGEVEYKCDECGGVYRLGNWLDKALVKQNKGKETFCGWMCRDRWQAKHRGEAYWEKVRIRQGITD